MEGEAVAPAEVIPAPEAPAPATITMFRKIDGRINHVAAENVQDYVNSGLWTVEV